MSKTAQKSANYGSKPIFNRPSTWIIAGLSLALLVVCGFSIYKFKSLEQEDKLESAKLATFEHLAASYITDMEFSMDDTENNPVIKKATGYGVSDEDGALYITFDYAPYPKDSSNLTYEDLDMSHAIIYFWHDAEHNTYSHAFGYYDDASYHPEGTYVELED